MEGKLHVLVETETQPAEPKKEIETDATSRFDELLERLQQDRRLTALEDRQEALTEVLRTVSAKYEPCKTSFILVSALVKAVLTSRSDKETILAVNVLCIMAATLEEDANGDADECLEAIQGLMPKLQSRIKAKTSSETELACYTRACAFLNYQLLHGSGAYELESVVDELVQVCETTTEKEALLCSCALESLALLISLGSAKTKQALAELVVPVLPLFLESSSTAVRIAACQVVGVLFEDGIECDREELEDALGAVQGESAKRLAKKDKREHNLYVRCALATITTGRVSEALPSFVLSGQKSLKVERWGALVLLGFLKWIYGGGLHNQIAGNPFIARAMHTASAGTEAGETVALAHVVEEMALGPKRRPDIRQARDEKFEAQGRFS